MGLLSKRVELLEELSIHLSIGDLLQWDFDDEAAELRVSNDVASIVGKALEKRLAQRNASILRLKQTRLSSAKGDTVARKSRQVFRDDDRKNELRCTEIVDAALGPVAYKDLMRYLLKRNRIRIAAAPLLVDYLNLSDSQKQLFTVAYKSSLAHPAEPERWVELLHAAEDSLTMKQLEEYGKAVGIIPVDLSLVDHFERLKEEDKNNLRLAYKVYRELK